MKRKIKAFISAVLAVIITVSSFLSAYSVAAPPRATLGAAEALPVGESVMCSCVIYSANGFSDSFSMNGNYFEISGTGDAQLSDFEIFTADGLTVTIRFKLTGTYPGEVKLSLKEEHCFDRAGLMAQPVIPKYIDIKLFNTEGENANKKMTETEYFFTVMVAPFWRLLNLIGIL